MRKLTISDKCIKCGECSLSTNLIRENPDGSVEPVVTTLSAEQADSLAEIISDCPVGAIQIEVSSTCPFKSKSELQKYAEDKLGNFTFSEPEYEPFNPSDYSIPNPYKRSNYEYKSDDKAIRAGLKEFDRIMYSQRDHIACDIVQRYASSKMKPFTEYVRENGNYYFDNYKEIEKILQELSVGAKELLNVDLPSDFTKFDVMPNWRFDELRDMGRNGVVLGEMLDDVEDLSWYDTFINTDDRTDYSGRKEVEVYRYDLIEVCDTLAEHILSGIKTSMDFNLRESVCRSVDTVLQPAKDELKNKLNIFIKAINV